MAIYALAPSPKWYFTAADGTPAINGKIQTFSSADHGVPKSAFSDPAGLHPYPSGYNGIPLDSTGGTPVPMYWEIDEAEPENGFYYIRVLDSAGNQICSIDKFPIIGGGGATPITANVDIENYVINGNFHFINADTTALSEVNPVTPGDHQLAPAGGFFKDSNGNYVQSLSGVYAGWQFFKAGGADSTDHIKFTTAPLSNGAPDEPNTFATTYFEYFHGGGAAPITDLRLLVAIPGVETFANKTITVSFDCSCDNNTEPEGEIKLIQYFGSGGTPSAAVITAETFNFNYNDWGPRIIKPINVPSVDSKEKGSDGNDCIYLGIEFPKNVNGTFKVTNIQIQLGSYTGTGAAFIYPSYSETQYQVLINLLDKLTAQTGDTKISLNSSASTGWIVQGSYTDTLGKSSGTHTGTQVKNLYIMVYNGFTNDVCPVSGGRTGNASNDFEAGKTIQLPPLPGRVFGAGGTGSLGTRNQLSFEGEYTHALTEAELAPHYHNVFGTIQNLQGSPAGPIYELQSSGDAFASSSTGSGTPFSIEQPTFYGYLHIKL